jgi:hypothetical protein
MAETAAHKVQAGSVHESLTAAPAVAPNLPLDNWNI